MSSKIGHSIPHEGILVQYVFGDLTEEIIPLMLEIPFGISVGRKLRSTTDLGLAAEMQNDNSSVSLQFLVFTLRVKTLARFDEKLQGSPCGILALM